MSRSGYSDDCDYLGLYRVNVDRAIAGKRGQAFLRELAAALDAMPVKELVADVIVRDEHVCAIGSVALSRKIDVSNLDPYDCDAVASTFGIAKALAAEIAFENDERQAMAGNSHETPSQRFARMRQWVGRTLVQVASATLIQNARAHRRT